MKLLVIHLSDIHYREKQEGVSERLRSVSKAVQNIDVDIAAIIIIVSGDIAFSGKKDEYAIAQQDLDDFLKDVRERFQVPVYFAGVPGNHDCDFTDASAQTRELVLHGLTRSAGPPPDSTTLDLCCSVHTEFFKFLDANQTSVPTHSVGRAYYEYLIPVGNGHVQLRCFNTAFSSSNPEYPGHLVYPTNLLTARKVDPPPLYAIAVFHHPYNWLTPETKRAFSDHIEQAADLILTGHEHRTAYYKKETFSGLASDYIEGAAFQQHDDASECGFNAVVIDFNVAQERAVEFRWEDDHFTSRDASGGWRPYRRSKGRRDFELTDAMLQRLEDPGATFSHPAKPKLVLEDIFVPPNAEELVVEDGKGTVRTRFVESRELLSTIAARRRVIIVGRERAGKSTLAKVVFRHFYYQGFVPILIEGDHIKSDHASGSELNRFQDLVQRRLREDYKNPVLDKFDQLDQDRVVLIIDDFDHAALNARGRLKLLEKLHKRYQRIIVLGDDVLRLEEFAYGELGAKILSDYTQYELKDYGHVLRSALIDKWYDINREYATNPDLLDEKITRAEQVIDDIIRRSYLPSYPIFILTMLQGVDMSQPIDSAAGSYGYLYQVLITDRLAKTAREISLDKKLGYLAELAYYIFKRRQRELSETDFQLFHAKYCEEFTAIDRKKMFVALEEAGILEIYDKHYRFKYAYFYYYFVAQYFARNLEVDEVRKSIVGLCNELQKEEHANIWLFLTHQSRSDFLLDTIVAHARKFFDNIATPEFDKDINFLAKLYDKVPALVLVNKTPEEMRQERRKKLDEEVEAELQEPDNGDNNQAVEFIIRLRAAIRTLEVMGQIVKNFAGSMKNDPRYRLVKECYELGLRVVGVILCEWERSSDQFVQEVLDVVLEKNANIESRDELQKKVKSFISFFCELIATNMVRRISQAVGTKDLSDTYQKVLEKNPTNSYKLIDLAVKLDNVGFPTGDVYLLGEEFQNNLFCHRLLSHLVLQHFYLFSTSEKTKQQVCSKLGIKMVHLRGIDARTQTQKRLPPPHAT